MSKSGKRPSNRREVLRYGRKLGGTVEEGGRHTKIYNQDTGRHVAVPRHNQIASGTLSQILSTLKMMFLVALVLALPLCALVTLVKNLIVGV